MADAVFKEGTLSALLGIQLEYSDDTGHGVVSMPFDSRHFNQMGNAHGGAIFTLADMAFAAGCHGAGMVCVSAQCSISYLAPGQSGPLKAEAIPVRLGKTLAVFDILVYDGSGRNIAKAVMTGYVLKRVDKGGSQE
jgi:acyl-CoA thioesterase